MKNSLVPSLNKLITTLNKYKSQLEDLISKSSTSIKEINKSLNNTLKIFEDLKKQIKSFRKVQLETSKIPVAREVFKTNDIFQKADSLTNKDNILSDKGIYAVTIMTYIIGRNTFFNLVKNQLDEIAVKTILLPNSIGKIKTKKRLSNIWFFISIICFLISAIGVISVIIGLMALLISILIFIIDRIYFNKKYYPGSSFNTQMVIDAKNHLKYIVAFTIMIEDQTKKFTNFDLPFPNSTKSIIEKLYSEENVSINEINKDKNKINQLMKQVDEASEMIQRETINLRKIINKVFKHSKGD